MEILSRSTILVVDDHSEFFDSVKVVLESTYDLVWANSCSRARSLLVGTTFDSVLLDIDLGEQNESGLTLLSEIMSSGSKIPVIMLTGMKSIELVLESIRKGAFDYCSKPPDRDRLLTTLRNAVEKCHSDRARVNLIDEARQQFPLVGSSSAIGKLRDRILRVAQSEASVLVTGETGTGKEVVARQIHFNSQRAGQKFVAVNMAGIPNELMEAELFGYLKGAFTGATDPALGYFGAAKGGTIFLDEIGLATVAAQSKILQVVELKEYRPLKATSPVRADVRIVAATSRDLDLEMKEGRFLPDLYYRLNAIAISVPPLRDHKSDAIELFEYFMHLKASESGVAPKQLSPAAKYDLSEYHWCGNVRELKNLVEKILVLSDEAIIDSNELRGLLGMSQNIENRPISTTLASRLRDCEREIIMEYLVANDYNRTATAAALGIHRVTLHDKLKEHGLEQVKR